MWWVVEPTSGAVAARDAFGTFLKASEGERLSEFLRGLRRGVVVAVAVQVGYAVASVAVAAWLFASKRPRLLLTLLVVAAVIAWIFKMTFEVESPLIAFAAIVGWALA